MEGCCRQAEVAQPQIHNAFMAPRARQQRYHEEHAAKCEHDNSHTLKADQEVHKQESQRPFPSTM